MGVGPSTASGDRVVELERALRVAEGRSRRAGEAATEEQRRTNMEAAELREALAQSQKLLEEAAASLDVERQTNESLTARNETLWADVQELRSAYDKLEARGSVAEAEAQRLRDQIQANRPSVESLREDLAQAQAKFLGAKERWKGAKLRNVILQVRVREVNHELAKQQRDAIMADQGQRIKIKQLRERCRVTQAELQGLKDSLRKIDAIADAASDERPEFMDDLDELQDISSIELQLPGAASED